MMIALTPGFNQLLYQIRLIAHTKNFEATSGSGLIHELAHSDSASKGSAEIALTPIAPIFPNICWQLLHLSEATSTLGVAILESKQA
ncbi:MAG: hypothetical protein F6K40_17535 [Okeania sp. SIO3I5]|uniref:hypothetical protein n=1 Tax=Okeania sp. SIO3I5 TaxID=2607805 RepID=UPI0013B760FD|nr:hypothetical protein [Okeania sp. SIO3I5]NEQ37968.1 hypothetical protein [Okeania sp. SIO3I5]